MSYIPTTWQDGDAITANKLNKIQEAVEARAVNPFLGSSFTAAQVKQILDLGMIPVITSNTLYGNESAAETNKKIQVAKDSSSVTIRQEIDYIIQFDENDYPWINTIFGKVFRASSWNSPVTPIDDFGGAVVKVGENK